MVVICNKETFWNTQLYQPARCIRPGRWSPLIILFSEDFYWWSGICSHRFLSVKINWCEISHGNFLRFEKITWRTGWPCSAPGKILRSWWASNLLNPHPQSNQRARRNGSCFESTERECLASGLWFRWTSMLLNPHPRSKANAHVDLVRALISANRKLALSHRTEATATNMPYDDHAGKVLWEHCWNSSNLDKES